MLGLAARAGGITSGSFLTEKAVKQGEAWFVILAEDASENTKKRLKDKCTYYHVPYVVCETQENLGHMIGKEARGSVTITDQRFARQIAIQFGIEI